jgi:phage N-6-adenine-methyltransferase
MKSKFSEIMLGERKTSEYGTPLDFFNKLNSIFHFEYDPCAFEDNRLGLEHYTTKKEHNGLKTDWEWNTFINPPFGTKKGEKVVDWIRKMKSESDKHPDKTFVMLLPTRIESNWFQEEIFEDEHALIYVIRGRLRFYNPETNKNNDPHPMGSVLYIRGSGDIVVDDAYKLMDTIPGMYIGWRTGI